MCEQYVVIIILYKVNFRRSYYLDRRPHMKHENRVLTISVKFMKDIHIVLFIFYFLRLFNVFFVAELRQESVATTVCTSI